MKWYTAIGMLMLIVIGISQWAGFELYKITKECYDREIADQTIDVSPTLPTDNRPKRDAPLPSQCNPIRDYYLIGIQIYIPKKQITTVTIPLSALRRKGQNAAQ